ncbi:MAG: hypothetical protein GX233_06995 [Erysipelothrix sp.]|nr:hypothetical protein [Erysipelothrix sp.]
MKKPMMIINRKVVGERVYMDDLERGVHYEDCIINESDDGVRLNEMMFTRCMFNSSNFVRSEILDVIFDHCDLSNFEFDNSHIYRCEFHNCKLMATSLYECFIKDVLFDRCMMNYSNISNSKVEDLSFVGGSAVEASFMNLKQKKMNFKSIDLEGSNFTETALKGIDLSEANFSNLLYSPHLIKGLSVNAIQAESLLIAMGVHVR